MTDHDRLFKELLITFIVEFIKLFLPKVAEYTDFSTKEILDKEIFTDVTAGEKHEADIIVKFRVNPEGLVQYKIKGSKKSQLEKDMYFLVHVENQFSSQTDFGKRMFIYFSRLYEKYGLNIYPIVVFSYDKPKKAAPSEHEILFPDLDVLKFKYKVIQLNRLDWRKFLDTPNPVASALMAKMNIAKKDEPEVKARCIAMMLGLQLDDARNQLLTGFIDSYLKLDAQENQVFNERLDKLVPRQQKEKFMEIMTSWEQRGYEIGKREGEVIAFLKLLDLRFGNISADIQQKIRNLSEENLNEFANILLGLKNLTDLQDWLNNHK